MSAEWQLAWEDVTQAFPQYQSFDVYGAVAGIEIDEGIDRYAYRKGLFVIKPSGDTVEIIPNPL